MSDADQDKTIPQWSDITASQSFQDADWETKQAVRARYFDRVVRPNTPDNLLEEVQGRFFTRTEADVFGEREEPEQPDTPAPDVRYRGARNDQRALEERERVRAEGGDTEGLAGRSAQNTLNRATDLIGGVPKILGAAVEEGEAFMDRTFGRGAGIIGGEIEALRERGYEPDVSLGGYGIDFTSRANPEDTSLGLEQLGQAVQDTGAEVDNRYGPERFIDNPSLANAGGMIAEQGPAAAVDMAAMAINLPAYMAARTQEIAEERAGNDGRRDPEFRDYLTAGPTAAASVALDRLALDKLLPGAGRAITRMRQVPGAVGRGLTTEGTTEALQEGGIEYAGASVNTEKGWSAREAGTRAVGGAIVGAPVGGGVAGVSATIEATREQAARAGGDALDQTMAGQQAEQGAKASQVAREQAGRQADQEAAIAGAELVRRPRSELSDAEREARDSITNGEGYQALRAMAESQGDTEAVAELDAMNQEANQALEAETLARTQGDGDALQQVRSGLRGTGDRLARVMQRLNDPQAPLEGDQDSQQTRRQAPQRTPEDLPQASPGEPQGGLLGSAMTQTRDTGPTQLPQQQETGLPGFDASSLDVSQNPSGDTQADLSLSREQQAIQPQEPAAATENRRPPRQQASEALGGAEVGDTITLGEEVSYSTKGGNYTITSIGRNGEVSVRNAEGGGTVWSPGEVRRIARGQTPTRVVERGPRMKADGTPYQTEKSARASRAFRNNPGATIQPVEGGFAVQPPQPDQDASQAQDGAAESATSSAQPARRVQLQPLDDEGSFEVRNEQGERVGWTTISVDSGSVAMGPDIAEGEGYGRATYLAASEMHPDLPVRSTAELSPQAEAMWEGMVRDGLATREEVGARPNGDPEYQYTIPPRNSETATRNLEGGQPRQRPINDRQAKTGIRLTPSTPQEQDLSGWREPKNGKGYVYTIERDGEPVGFADVSILDDGTARIEDIVSDKGELGQGAMRNLLRQLRREHPQVTRISGERVSGMRRGGQHGFAGTGEEVAVNLREDRETQQNEDTGTRYRQPGEGEMTWGAIERMVRPLRAEGIPVEVVNNVDGLPGPLRDKIRADGVEGMVAGVYYNRTTWLVADNLSSPKEVMQTVLHETVGHRGVMQVLGNDLARVMANIYRDMPARRRRELEARYAGQLRNATPEKARQIVAEEHVAHLAETDPESTVLDRVVSAIRMALRRLFGPGAAREWGRKEVVDLIAEARGAISGQGRRGDGPSYRLRHPVHLRDGSRLSGYNDGPSRQTFYGYDRNGVPFTLRRDRLNPEDITWSRDGNRSAEQLRRSFDEDQGDTRYALRAGAENPGVGVEDKNKLGFEPSLRVKIPLRGLKLPKKAGILQKTNLINVENQLEALDKALDKFPDAHTSPEKWTRMEAFAFASQEVPVPPYAFIRDLNGTGSEAKIGSLSEGQIADANHGFETAAEFRRRYENGDLDEVTTGKLFMWSFLSRGVSPYTQESLFIDAFDGVDYWIRKAADGNFTQDDLPAYTRWAKSVAPAGSGQPGAGAGHNLNAFGKNWLLNMSRRDADGVSALAKLHRMMSDPDSTGQQIRREYLRNAQGTGIDNKVVSFTLLVAGYGDVMVLDRVQVKQLWDDGRFDDRNLYDGRSEDGKPVAGSALNDITFGVRGLLVYEAVERGLAEKIPEMYASVGREEDASIGRYHWETWVAFSQQEASHGTLEAVLHDSLGDENAISRVTAKQGEYGAYEYGARYGVDSNGERYFDYTLPNGETERFDIPSFRQFLEAVKKPRNGVRPSKFKVTEAGNAPWYERPEVNQERLIELAREYAESAAGSRGSEGGTRPVQQAGQGEAAADGPLYRLSGEQRQRRFAAARPGRPGGRGTRGFTREGPADAGRQRVLARFRPTPEFRRLLQDSELGEVTLEEIEPTRQNALRFEQAVKRSKIGNKHGAAVFVYPMDEYRDMRLFMTEDGKSGFAIKDDGDIVSVFSDGGRKAHAMLTLATEQGGTKLDAFNTVLPQIYKVNGFREVGREPWNEEYRPEGWREEDFAEFNNGRPDVVFMEYDPAYNPFESDDTRYSLRGDDDAGRPEQARDRGGRDRGGEKAPLEGAPTVRGAAGPDPELNRVAEQYAREQGIDLRRQAEYVEVDVERAERIADAYEAMEHAPQDPRVLAAYRDMIRQTRAQYDALVDAGYEFFLFDGDQAPDPYDTNPWNAMRDLRANKRMGVFSTEAGFGSDEAVDVSDNPLLEDTGLRWPLGEDGPRVKVLANDLFRAVHDAFGHGLEGAGFRARGEENAWQAHARLFTGPALGALTSETRGQNSWLNYGPYGETNRNAGLFDTVFADQKTGLMPEWTWTEGRAGDMESDSEPRYSLTRRDIEERLGSLSLEDARNYVTVFLRNEIPYRRQQIKDLRSEMESNPDSLGVRRGLKDAEDALDDYMGAFDFLVGKFGPEVTRHETDPAVEEAAARGPISVEDRNLSTRERIDRVAEDIDLDELAADIQERQEEGSYNEQDFIDDVAERIDYGVQDGRPLTEMETQLVDAKAARLVRQAASRGDARYRVTDTPEFQRWFGDSVVVNEDGSPKVVYHGTDAEDFSAFRNGAWFSESPEESSAYARTGDLQRRSRSAGKFRATPGREMAGARLPYAGILDDTPKVEGEVYATDQAVARYLGDGRWELMTDVVIDPASLEMEGDGTDTIMVVLGDAASDVQREIDDFDGLVSETFPGGDGGRVMPVYLSIQSPVRLEPLEANRIARRMKMGDEEVDARIAEYEAQGYDGIVTESDEASTLPEVRESLGGVPAQYLAFRPEQVKSAFNRGTFDEGDSDIRYSLNDPEGGPYTANDSTNFAMPDETYTDLFLRKLADKFRSVKRLQDAIRRSGGRVNDDNDAYLAEELYYGKTETDLRRLEEDYVQPLVDGLAKAGISQADLDTFLYARHAPERNARMAERNPDNEAMQDGGSGMTDAQAEAVMEVVDASGKRAEFERLAGIVDEMLAARREAIREGGLMDDEMMDVVFSGFDFYVPLKGWARDEDVPVGEQGAGRPSTGRGFEASGKESKIALGRRTVAASPSTQAIVDTTEALIKRRKNEVAQALLSLVTDNPNPQLWQVFTQDNPDTQPQPVRRVDPETGRRRTVAQQAPVPMAMSDRYFKAKKNGEVYYIKIHHQQLMDALRNVGTSNAGAIVEHMASVVRVMSSLVTSYNPGFMVTNFARDAQTALLNIQAEQSRDDGKLKGKKIGRAVARDMRKAMRAAYRGLSGKPAREGDAGEWDRWFAEFMEAGAKTGYFDVKDVERQAKDIERMMKMAQGGTMANTRKATKTIADFVENINGAVENAVRLAAYANARRQGLTKKRAASLAKTMTVNFNRRGEMSTTLGAMYMFFNAAVQGTANFVRTMGGLKDPAPGRSRANVWSRLNVAQKLAVGMTAGAFVNAILQRMLSDEDEDEVKYWDKIKGHEKERSLIFMTGWATGDAKDYVKLPLPYGYNIFVVLGTSAADVAMGPKSVGEGAVDLTLATLGSFNPIGFEDSEDVSKLIMKNATPTIFRSAAQIAVNEDFAGRMIYKPDYDFGTPIPDSSRSFRTTPEAYKSIAEFLNKVSGGNEFETGAVDVSPDTLQHLVNFYGGGAWSFTEKVADAGVRAFTGEEIEPYRRPFLGRVTGVADDEYGDQGRFYERAEELGQRVNYIESREGDERRRLAREEKDVIRLFNRATNLRQRLSEMRNLRDRAEQSDRMPEARREALVEQYEARMKARIDEFNRSYDEAFGD